MSYQFKVGIVGYGKMGKIRAACVNRHPDMKLISVCDIVAQDLDQDVRFFTHYKEILDVKPDIVFVCVVNKYLAEIVCFFLRAGIHVFCEKPPGRNKEDAKLMLAEDGNNPGIKLKFGFNHRYHQAVLDAKALVDKGRLGKILWMRGIYGKGGGGRFDQNWRNQRDLSGGGILIDQGIHMVDLFRLFCGDFDEVQSFIGRHHWPIEVEDNAFVLLRNNRQQVAMLHSSATQWQYKFLMELCLERGFVTISGILSSTRNYGSETLKIARCVYDEQGYPLPNPEETISNYDENRSWMMELEEFVACIKENTTVQVGSCQEAYRTMLLIEKIYEADKQWRVACTMGGKNYENSSFGK